ncbi:MAG: adenine phosphoribosyltransferase [Bacteroidales bacterium]|nr:adenine phosphoribosyltransferase [Bacteroidales bacterium]
MTTEELLANIRVIEDFPVKGIHFQDVTTLFQNPECLKEIADRIVALYKDKHIDKVVGLESRGFVLGAIVAERLGAGFVPARKKGKLPGEKIVETYNLEYGFDCIEMHVGSINPGETVLIHDDLLATGGTLGAAVRLVEQFHPSKIYANTIIDLTACPRSSSFPKDLEVTSLLKIDVA